MLSKRKSKNSTKNLPAALQTVDPLENKLEYMNNKRPSKPSLPYVLELSKLLLPTDLIKPCLLQLTGSCNSTRLHPLNRWLLPMLPSSTKTSLYTQNGCGKCLGYQPLKDLDMQMQELKKPTMDYVEDCGYDNL